MCPACIGTVAWIAAGAASTGGLAALVASKLCSSKAGKDSDQPALDQGERYGNAESSLTR